MIGHSERRGEFGIFPMDDDSTLATKLKDILDAGMTCCYAIGEPLEVRKKGLDAVIELMDKQLSQIYSLLDPAKVVIAYEPVWAIGTGETATPEDAQATHAGIRKLIAEKASPEVAAAIRIQYGGSANAGNAADLSAQPDIDGFLVGGASLKAEIKEIVSAISAAKTAAGGSDKPASKQQAAKTPSAPMETQEDLKALAKSLNPIVGYWDPLGVGGGKSSLYDLGNEATIAWWRQAEIKHGRVAMAAFVGYCVQANGYHWPFKMTLDGADWPTGTPPEQWDALPQESKWQIILFAGALEAWDESQAPHYTNGRKPGMFPSFKGTDLSEREGGTFILDLYDPFGFSKNSSPERKARQLRAEINNGRLAMLAIIAFVSASQVPGSVPLLDGKIPPYSGDYMVPFQGNFTLFGN